MRYLAFHLTSDEEEHVRRPWRRGARLMVVTYGGVGQIERNDHILIRLRSLLHSTLCGFHLSVPLDSLLSLLFHHHLLRHRKDALAQAVRLVRARGGFGFGSAGQFFEFGRGLDDVV